MRWMSRWYSRLPQRPVLKSLQQFSVAVERIDHTEKVGSCKYCSSQRFVVMVVNPSSRINMNISVPMTVETPDFLFRVRMRFGILEFFFCILVEPFSKIALSWRSFCGSKDYSLICRESNNITLTCTPRKIAEGDGHGFPSSYLIVKCSGDPSSRGVRVKVNKRT